MAITVAGILIVIVGLILLGLGIAGLIQNGVSGTWPVWNTVVDTILILAGIGLISYGGSLRRVEGTPGLIPK